MSTRDMVLPKEEVKIQTRDDKAYKAVSKFLNPKIEKLSNQKLSVIYQKIDSIRKEKNLKEAKQQKMESEKKKEEEKASQID